MENIAGNGRTNARQTGQQYLLRLDIICSMNMEAIKRQRSTVQHIENMYLIRRTGHDDILRLWALQAFGRSSFCSLSTSAQMALVADL